MPIVTINEILIQNLSQIDCKKKDSQIFKNNSNLGIFSIVNCKQLSFQNVLVENVSTINECIKALINTISNSLFLNNVIMKNVYSSASSVLEIYQYNINIHNSTFLQFQNNFIHCTSCVLNLIDSNFSYSNGYSSAIFMQYAAKFLISRSSFINLTSKISGSVGKNL